MDKKPKLGFVVPSLANGGAERVVALLSNYFSKEYNVLVICLTKNPVFYTIDDSVKVKYLHEKPRSQSTFSGIPNNFAALKRLRRIVREEQISILIGFTTSANVLAIMAAMLTRIPCIISERNNAKVVPPNPFWKTLRNLFYRFADTLVVQTNGNKLFYSDLIREERIKIIQNPIPEGFPQKTDFTHTKKDKISLLYVGRLTKNKAAHIALQALKELNSTAWEFVIVGDGPQRQELETLGHTLGIEKHLKFEGRKKNVIDYYKQADIFVFTSRSEGFPNALTEAYYYGIPCVSSDCDFGPADIITDGTDGYLFPVDDFKLLSSKIQNLMTHPEIRSNFSKKAVSNSSRFEIKHITKSWTYILKDAMKTKPK